MRRCKRHDISALIIAIRYKFLFLLLSTSGGMTCPESCGCLWKGGKQTVECINKSLHGIHDQIDITTQVLDFSGNNLQHLPSRTFEKRGLVHLQKIFLSRCRITKIEDGAFRGLSNLVELDLSHNTLSAIPTATFHDYPALMRLNLNGNPLHLIESSAFSLLPSLISLELSKCQLDTVESNAFAGLNDLEWLKLDQNSLKYIPGAYTLPKRLHGISLQRNPWYCDCLLIDVYYWLNESNVPEAMEPTCDGPQRLRGAPIKLLDEAELACVPDVTPTSLYLEIGQGKNVSLLCKVRAVPAARISWTFCGRTIISVLPQETGSSSVSPRISYTVQSDSGDSNHDKKSELFIRNTNIDDNGTFACVAENQAGRFQSNYTIKILSMNEQQANQFIKVPKLPFETMLIMFIASTVFAISFAICCVICLLRRRLADSKRKIIKITGPKKNLAYANQNNNLTASSSIIADDVELVGSLAIIADINKKSNGDIRRNKHDSTLSVATSSYPAPPMNEQNPDLISDTERDRSNSQSGDEAITPLSTISSLVDQMAEKPGFGSQYCKNVSATSKNGAAAAAAITIIPTKKMAEQHRSWMIQGATTEMTETFNNTTAGNPLIVCLNPELHMTTEKHIYNNNSATQVSDSCKCYNNGNNTNNYPTDYGLPTPAYPMLTNCTNASNYNFYRTLPHKRHIGASIAASFNVVPSAASRLVREAEFFAPPLQPPSYEHYYSNQNNNCNNRINDIRYNVKGYPNNNKKPDDINDASYRPMYNNTAAAPHVKFSETVHIFGRKCNNANGKEIMASTNAVNKATQVEQLNSNNATINASVQTIAETATTIPVDEAPSYRINDNSSSSKKYHRNRNTSANSNSERLITTASYPVKFSELPVRQKVRLTGMSESADEGYVDEPTTESNDA